MWSGCSSSALTIFGDCLRVLLVSPQRISQVVVQRGEVRRLTDQCLKLTDGVVEPAFILKRAGEIGAGRHEIRVKPERCLKFGLSLRVLAGVSQDTAKRGV